MEIQASALEGLVMKFWKNKRVFITGHTGFKGSWLCLWLSILGTKVTGYALKPPTNPSLFNLCEVDGLVKSIIADVRDFKALKKAMLAANPEIVIHMAAQPIVRGSYKVPVETFSTNVMGTVNVLEAARHCSSVKAIAVVTTDKVYELKDKGKGFRENAPLGGHDPYSSSKACSELVAQAYRRSYGLNVATARAGNVIGGGDWAADRLVPDFIRAILKGKKIKVRNPQAVRPWQHVLEPLSGYLMLVEKLYRNGAQFSAAWNFGPNDEEAKTVEWLIKKLCADWGEKAAYVVAGGKHPHEAHYLKLDSTMARQKLGWQPHWTLAEAIAKVVEWTKDFKNGEDLRKSCLRQIEEYTK